MPHHRTRHSLQSRKPTVRFRFPRSRCGRCENEDYEYLAILQRLGKSAEAQKVVRSLTETFFQWDKDPVAYETARARLAAMIVAAEEAAGRK